MNVQEEINRVLRHGIALNTNTDEEDNVLRSQLFKFLIEKKNFCVLIEEEKTIVVSNNMEDVADIVLAAGTLIINPLAEEGFFKVFMDMIEFVAKKGTEN